MNDIPKIFERVAISVVVPVKDEEIGLREFYAVTKRILDKTQLSYEILFVNDGSSDSTSAILDQFQSSDSNVGSINLSRSFGKEYAVSAGLQFAQGDAIIVMDSDLQDPPACIPDMIANWQDGYDVVAMRRSDRSSDGFFKRTSAQLFYALMSKFSDVEVPHNVGDFRLMSRKVVNAVNELPENNRCLKGVFAWVGFKTKILEFKREHRLAGKTKWSFLKLVKLALDGITSFSIAPLRVASISGAALASVSFVYGSFILLKTLLIGEPVAGFTTLTVLITFLGGMQLLAIGVLGEYVGRTFIQVKNRPLYLIDQLNLPRNTNQLIHRQSSANVELTVQDRISIR